MGAQLLVGGDVQSGLADSISQLSSMTEIINQIVFFHGEAANEEAAELIDLNIRFEVPAGMMDFTAYEKIIAYGEKVAREHYDELKHLADSLNAIEYVPMKEYNTTPLDSFNIAKVIYRGNDKMSLIYLDNYFERFENKMISIDELEHVITRVYGTRFFKHVFYELEPVGDGKANLIIDLEEGDPGYVSATVHYDTDYGGSIRVNGIFRNVLGHRSKLFTELLLGSNPRFRAQYLISNGAKPGFGLEVDMYDFKFDDYDKKGVRINSYDFINYKASAFVSSVFNNLYSFNAGFEYEYFKFKQDIPYDSTAMELENFNNYGNFFITFRADTRNKSYFATTGFKTEFKALYAMSFSKGWANDILSNSFIFYVKYDGNFNLVPKLTLKPGLFLGGTLKQDIPPVQYWFGVGGLNEMNYVDTFVPFTGVDFVQRFAYYAAIVRLKVQYNVYEKLYLTLRSDFGSTSDVTEDIVKSDNFMFGYGLTASYDSFIGPVEFTVMGSNINPSLSFFANIGFNF